MKITVKFLDDSGQETMATFDRDAGTVSSPDGRTGTYSRSEGSRVVEIKGDVSLTLTFVDDIKLEPGFTTRYSTSDGRAGNVTIASIA